MRCTQVCLLLAAVAGCAAGADPLWCRKDEDCGTYYDSNARCESGGCVCSDGYAHPLPDVLLCVGNSTFADTVRVVFAMSENCSEMGSAMAVAVRDAVNTVSRGNVSLPTPMCTDTAYIVDVMVARPDLAVLYGKGFSAAVAAELKSAGLAEPTYVGMMRVDSLRCPAMPHAVEVEYRHPHCVVTICKSGYVVQDAACVVAPSTQAPPTPSPRAVLTPCHVPHALHTEFTGGVCLVRECVIGYTVSSDKRECEAVSVLPPDFSLDVDFDDGVSDGVVVGVVCGVVALVALIAVLVCLCLRKRAASKHNLGNAPVQQEMATGPQL
eukprot:TRINITY_DN247_c0_g1_i1.p1 TRINITY_DN247_c0_g1~~TRINITY_DN247_c0_g1_i1.p1  ORF type:complete len:324 (+),score=77.51 TRINITY_DN247_c0_g1_i1:53-1024(+)